jgi:hypothetical protein
MSEDQSGRVAGWVSIVKGLSLTNVLIIALIAMVAVPVYFVYRVLNDPVMLDRFMSFYGESVDESGCTLHTVKAGVGSLRRWSVSTGFASTGSDRYVVAVILTSEPKPATIATYCTTLTLMADKMQGVKNAP